MSSHNIFLHYNNIKFSNQEASMTTPLSGPVLGPVSEPRPIETQLTQTQDKITIQHGHNTYTITPTGSDKTAQLQTISNIFHEAIDKSKTDQGESLNHLLQNLDKAAINKHVVLSTSKDARGLTLVTNDKTNKAAMNIFHMTVTKSTATTSTSPPPLTIAQQKLLSGIGLLEINNKEKNPILQGLMNSDNKKDFINYYLKNLGQIPDLKYSNSVVMELKKHEQTANVLGNIQKQITLLTLIKNFLDTNPTESLPPDILSPN